MAVAEMVKRVDFFNSSTRLVVADAKVVTASETEKSLRDPNASSILSPSSSLLQLPPDPCRGRQFVPAPSRRRAHGREPEGERERHQTDAATPL